MSCYAGIIKDAVYDFFNYDGLPRSVFWRDIGIMVGAFSLFSAVTLPHIRLEDPNGENFMSNPHKNLNFEITGVCTPSHQAGIKLHRDVFVSE